MFVLQKLRPARFRHYVNPRDADNSFAQIRNGKIAANLQRQRNYSSSQDNIESRISFEGTTKSEDYKEFVGLLPNIIKSLTSSGGHFADGEASDWFAEVMRYNLSGGKMIRGLNTVHAYKALEKPDNLTKENIELANVLGWCVEMFQALFLITDDLMDDSQTRRGQPCWHRRSEVGKKAVNDAMMVSSAIFILLKMHFQNHPGYQMLYETLNEMMLKTCIGQYLDMDSVKKEKSDINKFTMKRYVNIVKHKSAYYTTQMPINLAMITARFDQAETFQQVNEVLQKIGVFFQIQDDYLDCFGNTKTTGKIGTDIREGKCTWLAVTALERATESQRSLMTELYGSKNLEDNEIIRELYRKLKIQEIYRSHEEDFYKLIMNDIEKIKTVPQEVFLNTIKMIYKRQA